jgi:ATP-dependent RNA helicase DeaD
LRARRLDVTRAALRERILAGELDDVRVVVQSLAEEFDILDIAAAAVKLAHAAEAGDDAERDIPVVAPPPERPREGPRDGPGGRPRVAPREGPRDPKTVGRLRPRPQVDPSAGDVARLFIGAGREAGIRPGDLVGAITGEAGINSRELGAIEIADRFSLIEVPESRAEEIIPALRATTLRGRKVPVRRDRAQG